MIAQFAKYKSGKGVNCCPYYCDKNGNKPNTSFEMHISQIFLPFVSPERCMMLDDTLFSALIVD